MHPHFKGLESEIAKLIGSGIASGLEDGYSKALALRPDLATQTVKPKPKQAPNQAEKVKRAKRAAAGVKSSGTVGTKAKKPASSWEEEVASHFQ